MPSVMSKRTVAVMAELDEKTKTKKPHTLGCRYTAVAVYTAVWALVLVA